jgi:FkbM family methyltransferase
MGLKEIKILDGIPFIVSEEDKGLSQNLIKWGNREAAATNFFQTFLNKDDVVLDIGANLGYYVVQEARVCKHVYAIEPMIINYNILLKNIELNKYVNVDTFNCAIGETDSKQNIYHCEQFNLSKMLPVDGWDKTEIDMLTGKTLINNNINSKGKPVPNVLRMDVEGYELKIIESFEKKFSIFDKLFIEIHHFELKDFGTHKLLNDLKSFGFNKVYVISTDKLRHHVPNIEPVIIEGWLDIDEYNSRYDYYHVTYLFAVKGDGFE